MRSTTSGPLVPYMRQSRAKERTISIDEQRRDIHRWAQANGVTLATEIVEQGVSGSKAWRERDLGEAIEACERGEAGGVIVAFQDRLSRENARATAEVWEALECCGARLVCAAEGLDTATGDHEMLFSIKAAIAREAWKRYRANWARARRNANERGVYNGRAPLGYGRDSAHRVVIARGSAPKQVREAFELRAQGAGYPEIARRLGWTVAATRLRLMNDIYAGANPLIPALVSRDLFERANAARTTRPVPAGAKTKDLVLVGRRLARCAGCGKTLKVVQRGALEPVYYCHNAGLQPCPSRGYVEVAKLEDYVCAAFELQLRTAPRLIDATAANRKLVEAQAERDKVERHLADFVKRAAHLGLGDTFEDTVRDLQKQRDRAQARVNELRGTAAPSLPPLGRLVDVWPTLSPSERGDVLAGSLQSIVVEKGASRDLTGCVAITWRDGTPLVVAEEEQELASVAA